MIYFIQLLMYTFQTYDERSVDCCSTCMRRQHSLSFSSIHLITKFKQHVPNWLGWQGAWRYNSGRCHKGLGSLDNRRLRRRDFRRAISEHDPTIYIHCGLIAKIESLQEPGCTVCISRVRMGLVQVEGMDSPWRVPPIRCSSILLHPTRVHQ
jgi:hypothetical protein